MKILFNVVRISIRWFFGQRLSALLISLFAMFLSGATAANASTAGGLIDGIRVPVEVQIFVENYLKDSVSSMCLKNNISFCRLDPSIKLSDIEAGVPIHEYVMDMDRLTNETIPISEVVHPVDSWQVPIRAHGKYIYVLTITKVQGKYMAGITAAGIENWERSRTFWPESSSYIPILVDCGPNLFFHFPQIDDHNLMQFRQGYKIADSVAIALNESTGDNNPLYISPGIKNKSLKTVPGRGGYLSDSKKIFRLLKKRELKNEEDKKLIQRMRIRDTLQSK